MGPGMGELKWSESLDLSIGRLVILKGFLIGEEVGSKSINSIEVSIAGGREGVDATDNGKGRGEGGTSNGRGRHNEGVR